MIHVNKLSKSFGPSSQRSLVLDEVSFTLADGTFTTIFGPNGCGKTTLINIITGLDHPDSGAIDGLESLQGNIGYVFQDYRRSLLPWASVEENISFPLRLRKVSKQAARKRVEQLIALSGLELDLKQRVTTLSGGQAQAACILRALVIEPKLLILDEPFAALDYERTLSLRTTLSELCTKLSLTVLFVSHDLEEAVVLGDQLIFFSRRPCKVQSILSLPLPKPRTADVLASAAFHELKRHALREFQTCIAE